MKKSNKIALGAAVLAVVATVGGVALSAGAAVSDQAPKGQGFGQMAGNNWTEEQKGEFFAEREARRAEMETRREAVSAALAAGDYQAWQEAAGDACPMAGKITADNFPRLAEAHQKMAEARSIMEELGLEGGYGMGGIGGFGKGMMRHGR